MQHLLVILIVIVCAFFIGRRLYRNLSSSSASTGCGCGCDCSGCGPDLTSICHPEKKPDNAP